MNEEYEPPKTNPSKHPQSPRQNTSPWIYICLTAAVFSVIYRLVVLTKIEQTAILFIGIPLVLSIILANTPKPSSATGSIMKGITLCLLLFGILLIEGVICILIAAPLFYLVGAIIGYLVDRQSSNTRLHCACFFVIGLMSLEGIVEALSFDRNESVVIEKIVKHKAEDVLTILSQTPTFDNNQLPIFLKAGFPLPSEIIGSGLNLGDRRHIHFSGGEGAPGDLVAEVTESTTTRISFSMISDKSHINHWLTWKSFTWIIAPNSNGTTRVSLEITYTRELDPAWYFKPVERYGVRKSGEFIIDSLFNQ